MATIKDIAEAAGVSIGTIDRIIHERGRYSEKTALKVKKLMKEFGYVPNIHARGLKNIKRHAFSAVIPRRDQDSGYWELVYRGLEKGAAELNSFGSTLTIYEFDRYSRASCIKSLETALQDGSEGIITAPVRPLDMGNTLTLGGKPFIFIDSDIPEMEGKISFIGQDSNQSGILSARLMSLVFKGIISPKVLVIEPPGDNLHLKSRIDGFETHLQELEPDISLVREKIVTYSKEGLQGILEASLGGAHQPDGLFVANSLVYDVALFIESESPEYDDIHLIGYDMIPGKEHYIRNGIIDFIITQQPERQGFRGVISLYEALVLGKDIPTLVNTPLHIITKENLETFISED